MSVLSLLLDDTRLVSESWGFDERTINGLAQAGTVSMQKRLPTLQLIYTEWLGWSWMPKLFKLLVGTRVFVDWHSIFWLDLGLVLKRKDDGEGSFHNVCRKLRKTRVFTYCDRTTSISYTTIVWLRAKIEQWDPAPKKRSKGMQKLCLMLRRYESTNDWLWSRFYRLHVEHQRKHLWPSSLSWRLCLFRCLALRK